MATPHFSEHSLVMVPKVFAAYDAGGGYNTVARNFGMKASTVQRIMRKFSPGSIRVSHVAQLKVRIQPKPRDEALTLAALGLMRVGPCRSCGVPLVAPRSANPVKGRTCGLCLHSAKTRKAVGRAA